MLEIIENLGSKFPNKNSKRKRVYCLYRCYCGKEFEAQKDSVSCGNTKSCGCLQRLMASNSAKIKSVTHGYSSTTLYQTWCNMHKRCYKENSNRYYIYGGRGIKVCERWHTLENFINDMHGSWKEGLSIDRIDNDGNYEPSNCRWVTREVQARNRTIIQSNNTSGFKGVSYQKSRKKYIAQIVVNGINKNLGRFNTAEEAAYRYNKYIKDNNLEHTINNID